MSLLDYIEHGSETLVGTLIRRIREFAPKDKPYWGAFGGGKDSVLLKWLASQASVDVKWVYNVTTLDPPELIKFIKREHPDVEFWKPRVSLKELFLEKKFPPTRFKKMGGRWCCEELKERTPDGWTILTGIRWAESGRRSQRMMVERCWTNSSTYVHPIIDIDDEQLWSLIHNNNIPYDWTRKDG